MNRKVFFLCFILVLVSFSFGVAEEAPKRVEIGKKFVDFTARSLDSDEFSFSQYIKGKSVALKFGATWCGPCRKMWDELEKIYEDVDDFTVVEVDLLNALKGETEDKVRKENKKLKTPWPVILDEGDVAGKYMSRDGIPQTFLIDSKGIVKYYFAGYRPYESIKGIIDAVKNGTPLPGQVGSIFPDFTLKDCEDKEFNLAAALKKGPVVVKFGATWCGPCRAMLPVLNDLVDKVKKTATVVEVDLVDGRRETVAKVKDHFKKDKPKYRVLLDIGQKVFGNVDSRSIPVTIVLDKYSRVSARFVGAAKIGDLEEAVKKAKKAKKPKKKKDDKDEKKKDEDKKK